MLISYLFLLIIGTVFGEWKIINGSTANIHEYPSIVSLKMFGDHLCGGTLINGNTVLTAAHCVWDFYEYRQRYFDLYEIKVVLGEHDLFHETGREKAFIVKKIYIHPEYDKQKAYLQGNDIALIEFNGYISNDEVHYIKYNSFKSYEELKPGDRCEIVGWGSMMSDGKKKSQFLQKAYLDIITNDECAEEFYNVKNNMANFCAGRGALSIAACKGDSGGPMFCRNSINELIQVGIVSYGRVPCGFSNVPTVFTKISHYFNWIDSILNMKE